MSKLGWRSVVDVWELREEPSLTEVADFWLASHVDAGSLVDMIRLVLSKPQSNRGRFVFKLGERIMYRQEIENLAKRPDFPGTQ